MNMGVSKKKVFMLEGAKKKNFSLGVTHTFSFLFKCTTTRNSIIATNINKIFTTMNICSDVTVDPLAVLSVTLCRMKVLVRNMVTINPIRAGIMSWGIQNEHALNT